MFMLNTMPPNLVYGIIYKCDLVYQSPTETY